jgi:hypothetical protein
LWVAVIVRSPVRFTLHELALPVQPPDHDTNVSTAGLYDASSDTDVLSGYDTTHVVPGTQSTTALPGARIFTIP